MPIYFKEVFVKRLLLPFVFAFSTTSLFSENLDTLLAGYKKESDFSKITARDTAGILDIYTRDDLEKMQVHTLADLLRIVPGLTLLKNSNNSFGFTTPSSQKLSLSYSRLYINDHDITSSSFGSAFIIWGDLPIEYIDHIEIYKGTSSMEFGNENAALIIRLYTKDAKHDAGSKVRLMADNFSSYDMNFYNADIVEDAIDYFAYANLNTNNYTTYHNIYNNTQYNFDTSKNGYNIFGHLHYHALNVDIGYYKEHHDDFMGIGLHRTPTGGGLDAFQGYIHLTNKFDNGIKLQLSYDKLRYTREYIDPNGIRGANIPIINNYNLEFDDDIFSFILEKKFHLDKHNILLGTFYKYKEFEAHGHYATTDLSYNTTNNFSNALHLCSIYAEDTYKLTPSFSLSTSLKGDFFNYQKDVKKQRDFLFRIGAIKSFDTMKFKLFYSKGYMPLAMYQVYNPQNLPYKANPQLDAPSTHMLTASFAYHNGKHKLNIDNTYMYMSERIMYDTTTQNGWINSDADVWKNFLQLSYSYTFDINNKLIFEVVHGKNKLHTNFSPAIDAIIRSFNTYQKVDFYNELTYKSDYITYDNITLPSCFNFTSAIKYHYTKDLLFGIRGENLFKSGFQQRYVNYSTTLPTYDRKLWINMEYSF